MGPLRSVMIEMRTAMQYRVTGETRVQEGYLRQKHLACWSTDARAGLNDATQRNIKDSLEERNLCMLLEAIAVPLMFQKAKFKKPYANQQALSDRTVTLRVSNLLLDSNLVHAVASLQELFVDSQIQSQAVPAEPLKLCFESPAVTSKFFSPVGRAQCLACSPTRPNKALQK